MTDSPYIYGLDPDLRDCACAILDRRTSPPTLVTVRFFRAAGHPESVKLGMVAAVARGLPELFLSYPPNRFVAEGQDLTYTGKTNRARPQDIANLSVVAGAAMAIATYYAAEVKNPLPKVWKGSVPKEIHQGRVFKAMGIPFEQGPSYCYPKTPMFNLPKTAWADAADAVGLALWGC